MKDLLLIKQASLLRVGIVSALEDYYKLNVFAYGSTEVHAIKHCLNEIDLVLIDLDTPINIIDMIEVCKKKNKKIIVWASSVTHFLLIKTFKMRLNGYFYNGMESQELTNAIDHIINSQTFIHPSLSNVLLEDYTTNKKTIVPSKPVGLLTRREWKVMELMTKGFRNEQIGNSLYISDKTVKNHVSSILKKFQVVDRTNAVLLALKKRWVTF
jgi:two-component system response regulator DegU